MALPQDEYEMKLPVNRRFEITLNRLNSFISPLENWFEFAILFLLAKPKKKKNEIRCAYNSFA